MDLFILRHGKAGQSSDNHEDSARKLTKSGRSEIRKVARWMKKKNLRFDCIATSPLARAYQTAEIVAKSLDLKDRLEVWDELVPGGDLDTLCYHASQAGKDASVILVGHEPGLSDLICRIVTGGDTASLVIAKGGLAKIRNFSFDDKPSGELQWLLTPGQILDMQ
jgi:phosphohistidine phosphatase